MNNKKGFTLVELLAVIVILGVLLSVTTVAVNSIKKKQDEKNKLNVISGILTGAKHYVTDNNKSTGSVKVSVLLNENYVDFDQDKYSNLINLNVNYTKCSNSIKRKFEIKVDNKKYNDCGCEGQALSQTSSELCIGN